MELTGSNKTNRGSAATFVGDVYVNAVHRPSPPSTLFMSLVRFTPGARTNWHSHELGQALVCTDGVGLVVSRDGTVIRLSAGDTVWTPPGEEHWHGAGTECMMTHLAVLEQRGRSGASWLEPVGDEEYAAANAALEPGRGTVIP